jgi:tetratricopeptide (TPR) repeat protein
LMLADLYAATDRIELAEDQLKMALNQYPKNADVQHAMALVLEQKGDVVGAGQHFDAAIRLDPRNELFKLSQETTSAAIRSMNEEASSVVLATANIPVFSGAEGASEGLTLRFNDSDNTSSNQTQLDPQLDYPETAVGGPGIEERVEELKAILESMPTENEESNKSLSKRQPMIRLPS